MLLSTTVCQHIKKVGVRSQTNERNADKYILVTWQSMLHRNIVSLGWVPSQSSCRCNLASSNYVYNYMQEKKARKYRKQNERKENKG